MPLEDRSQFAHSKSGREQFVLAHFGLQVFGSDFRRLGCTRQGAGDDQIRSHLATREEFRNVAYFFFTRFGERARIIRFLPIWPTGLTMTKEIQLHVDLYALLHGPPLGPACARFVFNNTGATEKSVPVVS